MTDAEHDHALSVFAERLLRALDSRPLEVATRTRDFRRQIKVEIPFSDLVSEDDLVNVIAEIMREAKTEFAPWGWDEDTTPEPSDNMRAALQEIADSHIPDQPAAAGGDDLVWAQRHVGKLRGIALAALS